MINLLKQLGLSEKEAKVYTSSLEIGIATAHAIAKHTKLNRTTTYLILNNLIELGFINYIEKNGVKNYQASDPNCLFDYLNAKKELINNQEKLLKRNFDLIQSRHNMLTSKPVVRYFDGAQGLIDLEYFQQNLLIESGQEMYAIAPIDLIELQFSEKRENTINERVKKGIWTNTIYTHVMGEIPDDVHNKELRRGIFLPRSIFDINETICIYPDWGVKVFNYDPENHFGIAIQSKVFAQNMLQIMKLAMLAAKAIENGTMSDDATPHPLPLRVSR